jgi:hypothetical protein
MTKYLSDQNKLTFIHESGTYGAGSGVEWSIGYVQEHTPEENVNVIPIRYQGSQDRNVDDFVDGNLDFTGTFTYFPQDFRFLGFAIGSISETASAGSHMFTETNSNNRIVNVADQSLTSFTLKDWKVQQTTGSNFIRQYNGCLIDSFSFTATQGEVVSAEVGYVAQSNTFSSGANLGISGIATNRPYIFSDVQLQIPSGTAMDNLTEVTFTVNNNIESSHYLTGSRQIKEGLPLNRDYEVSNTYVIDGVNAKTLYDQYYIGGSQFNCMLKLMGTPGSAYIVMSGCKVVAMSVPSPLDSIQEQTMTFAPQHVNVTVFDAVVDYNAW